MPLPTPIVAEDKGTVFPFRTISTSSMTLATEVIVIPDHGLDTGDPVVYTKESGPAARGLVDGRKYFVRVLDEDRIHLYDTYKNASIVVSTIGKENIKSPGNNTQRLTFVGTATVNYAFQDSYMIFGHSQVAYGDIDADFDLDLDDDQAALAKIIITGGPNRTQFKATKVNGDLVIGPIFDINTGTEYIFNLTITKFSGVYTVYEE